MRKLILLSVILFTPLVAWADAPVVSITQPQDGDVIARKIRIYAGVTAVSPDGSNAYETVTVNGKVICQVTQDIHITVTYCPWDVPAKRGSYLIENIGCDGGWNYGNCAATSITVDVE